MGGRAEFIKEQWFLCKKFKATLLSLNNSHSILLTMPKKVNTLYPIENDWKSLSATLRNKIDAGVIIAGESVQKYYDIEDMPAVLRDAADAMERGSKVIFIPQFETENFMQGFMYRPSRGQKIDAFYNRTFYPKHFANLFDSGYDPVLAGIGDILYDARSEEVVNFDARHKRIRFLRTSGSTVS